MAWSRLKSLALAAVTAARSLLAYDAIAATNKRAPVQMEIGSEDDILKPRDRLLLHSGVRDLHRNSSLFGWIVRRHLDFVSAFRFQCRHPDKEFRKSLEAWSDEIGKAEVCDSTRRFSRDQLMRFTEALRTIEGDVLHVHRSDDSWQLVRHDRIRNPEETTGPLNWVNGVGLDKDGAPQGYAVFTRDGNKQYAFDRVLKTDVARLHGYFESTDQYRGVTPLASGLNPGTDIYKNFDLAMAKHKLAQVLGIVMYEGSNPIPGMPDSPGTVTVNATNSTGGPTKTTIDFGKGPQVLRQKVGEKVELLQGQVTGSDFLAFHETQVMLCLKCLDLPVSFLDEAHTNWVGQQSALQIYKASARFRRDQNRDLLAWHRRMELTNAVLSGRITLPAGETVDSVLTLCDWVPVGLPWWNPSKQIDGDKAAVAAGFTSPQRVCAENGTDFETNCQEIRDALAMAAEAGIKLDWSLPQAVLINTTSADAGGVE